MTTWAHRWVRVYRRLLDLLPPGTPRDQRDEMAQLLRDMVSDSNEPKRTRRVLRGAYKALPLFLLTEWWEAGMELVFGPPRHSRYSGRWEAMMRQFRLALRSLVRSPAFAASTLALIALGVGAVTTVFTLVDHVLLRPLPYPEEDRLVFMENGSHSGPMMREMPNIEGLEEWTATLSEDANLIMADGRPVRLRRARVTPSFFPMFDAQPRQGRVLTVEDDATPNVAVATHSAWMTVWGSDPNLVGRTVPIDGESVRIVGVLGPDWQPPAPLIGRTVDLIAPVDWANPRLEDPQVHRHQIAGLLAAGQSLETVDEQVGAMNHRVREAFPDLNLFEPDLANPTPLVLLRDRTVERVQRGLVFLLAAVGLLLLVACVNVAHLFLARGIARQREMAVRRALGASVSTLTGQLATEAAVVGIAGGMAGLVLAWSSLKVFQPWMADSLPRSGEVTLDLRIFGFAFAASILTATIFGLLPTVRSLSDNVNSELRGAGRGVSNNKRAGMVRSSLVVVEVALSLILVATSGLMLRSFITASSEDPGVAIENRWVIPVDFPESIPVGEFATTMEQIRLAVTALPEVQSASFGIEGPFEWTSGSTCCWTTSVTDPQDSENTIRTRLHTVQPDFFETYGIQILTGAAWNVSQVEQVPFPGVINEGLAIRLYGSGSAALGQILDTGGSRQYEITGVANDARYYGLDRPVDNAIYTPAETLPFPIDIGTFGILVRETTPGLATRLREAVWSVEPELPLPTVVPLNDWVEGSSATWRFRAMLLVFFGFLALVLAAGGLYGTLLHAVNQRRRELGIRMALGAKGEQIQGMVVGQGVKLAAVGAFIGLGVTWYLRHLLERWVYGIPSFDPMAIGTAVAALMATACIASWVPAFRASRTDPRSTLNAE